MMGAMFVWTVEGIADVVVAGAMLGLLVVMVVLMAWLKVKRWWKGR